MTDWHSPLAAPIEAAHHGIQQTDHHFNSIHDGPLTFDRIQYPAAQTYLEGFERAGGSGTEYQVNVSTTLYFEWDRDSTTTEDVLHPVAAVLSETLSAFAGISCIGDYHPSRIDFFSGQPESSLVVAVSIQFRVTTLLDPGEFSG